MKKKIMVLLITVLMVGVAGAALVGYLSNTVTADITVESPMIAGISLGEDGWDGECFPDAYWDYVWEETISVLGVHGGETVTLYTMTKNIADVEITGFEEAIVTNWDGVTCEDFESVRVRVDSIYGDLCYGTEHELIPSGCVEIDDYHVQFGSPGSSLWGAGEADVTRIVVTFKTDAIGTYTFIGRVVPVT